MITVYLKYQGLTRFVQGKILGEPEYLIEKIEGGFSVALSNGQAVRVTDKVGEADLRHLLDTSVRLVTT